jgi:ABC-type lipoprotein release transport system permease subunit
MKNHISTLLLAMLGIVVSVTILLSLLYTDLSMRESLTTKIRQIDPAQAEEQNK